MLSFVFSSTLVERRFREATRYSYSSTVPFRPEARLLALWRVRFVWLGSALPSQRLCQTVREREEASMWRSSYGEMERWG